MKVRVNLRIQRHPRFFQFKARDVWVGAYLGKVGHLIAPWKSRNLFVCILPMLPLCWIVVYRKPFVEVIIGGLE